MKDQNNIFNEFVKPEPSLSEINRRKAFIMAVNMVKAMSKNVKGVVIEEINKDKENGTENVIVKSDGKKDEYYCNLGQITIPLEKVGYIFDIELHIISDTTEGIHPYLASYLLFDKKINTVYQRWIVKKGVMC